MSMRFIYISIKWVLGIQTLLQMMRPNLNYYYEVEGSINNMMSPKANIIGRNSLVTIRGGHIVSSNG